MPSETLERRTETLEEAMQQVSCQLALLRQHVDEGFKAQSANTDALAARIDKFEARTDARFDKVDARFDKVDARFDKVDARFDKVESMIDKSEARGMAAMRQLYDQLEKRVDKLESGFRWQIGLQVTTLVGVLGLAARLI